MNFIYGRGWVYQEEANDGTEGGAGAGDTGAPAGDGGDEGGGADTGIEGAGGVDGAAAPAAAKKEEAPKDMKTAIDAALGYKKGPNGEALDPMTGKPKEEKTAPAKPAATEPKETDTHHANGKPKKSDKGEDLDAEGKVVAKAAAKVKTAAELDLKPEEKKALGTKAQIRFGELINTVKAHETRAAKDGETIKGLTQARDAILGVMEETKTTQDQLAGYLEFNALLQSNDPKDLESALQMVEAQREALYKALGKEPAGGGVDLLKDFPDLAKQVEDEEITRAAALEIAKSRRERAAREQAQNRQQNERRTKEQTADQQKKAGNDALAAISTWTAGLSKSDLDYKAKEDKLLAKVNGVIEQYPPHLWLPTLKMMYEGIEVQKAPATTGGQNRPLRPSGAKPGEKKPGDMLEAINQGLGYAVKG